MIIGSTGAAPGNTADRRGNGARLPFGGIIGGGARQYDGLPLRLDAGPEEILFAHRSFDGSAKLLFDRACFTEHRHEE